MLRYLWAQTGESVLTNSPWSTGAVFGLLTAAIAWLYKARDKDRDEEIARLEKQIERLEAAIEKLREIR